VAQQLPDLHAGDVPGLEHVEDSQPDEPELFAVHADAPGLRLDLQPNKFLLRPAFLKRMTNQTSGLKGSAQHQGGAVDLLTLMAEHSDAVNIHTDQWSALQGRRYPPVGDEPVWFEACFQNCTFQRPLTEIEGPVEPHWQHIQHNRNLAHLREGVWQRDPQLLEAMRGHRGQDETLRHTVRKAQPIKSVVHIHLRKPHLLAGRTSYASDGSGSGQSRVPRVFELAISNSGVKHQPQLPALLGYAESAHRCSTRGSKRDQAPRPQIMHKFGIDARTGLQPRVRVWDLHLALGLLQRGLLGRAQQDTPPILPGTQVVAGEKTVGVATCPSDSGE